MVVAVLTVVTVFTVVAVVTFVAVLTVVVVVSVVAVVSFVTVVTVVAVVTVATLVNVVSVVSVLTVVAVVAAVTVVTVVAVLTVVTVVTVVAVNPYETSSAAAALKNDFKKRYKRAGCSSSKFWLFRAAVESPLTAINSAVAAVQKIPESRSALQSGFEKTKNVVTGNGLALVSTKKKKKYRLQQYNNHETW